MERILYTDREHVRYKVCYVLSAGYCLLGHATVKRAREFNFVSAKFLEIDKLIHEVIELREVSGMEVIDVDELPFKQLTDILDQILAVVRDSND